MDSPHFFFSFELSYLRVPKKPRLAGTRGFVLIRHDNLLLSAVSLCRMVLCGLE